MEKFTKEELILQYLADPEKLYRRFWSINKIEPTDELLEAVLDIGDPECTYFYAKYVDETPRDSTREAVCKEPIYAYLYARNVDKGYHEDTWNAVQKSRWYRGRYDDLIAGRG